jgi:hypothetical protein
MNTSPSHRKLRNFLSSLRRGIGIMQFATKLDLLLESLNVSVPLVAQVLLSYPIAKPFSFGGRCIVRAFLMAVFWRHLDMVLSLEYVLGRILSKIKTSHDEITLIDAISPHSRCQNDEVVSAKRLSLARVSATMLLRIADSRLRDSWDLGRHGCSASRMNARA